MKNLRGVLCYLGAVFLLLLSAVAQADSWAGPQTREVFSESREYFVRVIPGQSLGDVVGFSGAKKGDYARADFYRRTEDRGYELTKEISLLNPIAPVEFFVADNGHLATVDNWHNVGYGEVISVFDAKGKLIRSWTLADLFQSEEIERFSHSVSSIHWRDGPAYIRQDQKTLLLTHKSGGDFPFGLESGRYKYCEYHEKVYRCRNSSEPRKWQPGNSIELTR